MSKKTPVNKPVTETYVHTFEGKVQTVHVNVHVNYHEGTVSLIDHNPHNPSSVKAKQWIFGGRELEYMQGWQDILDAMKSAVEDATKRLKDYQKANPEK